MRIIPIPVKYEWIERIFGTEIANNFNEISFAFLVFGFLVWAIFLRKPEKKAPPKRESVQKQREFAYRIDENGHLVPDHSYGPQKSNSEKDPAPIAEEYFGQYDRYADLTDEEMKLAMQIRIERKHPTFEEWKAQKLKEQQETEPE